MRRFVLSTRPLPAQSARVEPSRFRLPGLLAPLVITALVLAVAGVGVAAYLAIENVQGQTGVCVMAKGCHTVQQSSYGKVLGVPVSVPGLALYALLAVSALAWLTDFRGLRPLVLVAGFYGSFAGAVFSAYLTYLEAFVIDAWCIYCIVSALLMAGLSLLWGTVFAVTLRDSHRERDEFEAA